MPTALATARAEAKAAFGDDAVYLEKYLQRPRHIEIQVLGDGKGHAIHLGERDCSLQRRHQKVLEESPSPALNTAARDTIGETVAKAMRELKYLGVGTVEFLYEDGQFYFIEMNTRIQVEHPVTEMITDIDLVLEQIRVAAGGDLPLAQKDVKFHGHAIECRINAENPSTFRPSPGKILSYHPPGGLGVRVDSAVYQGYTIPPFYDSLVGKLIVHGKTRGECLMRLKRALDEFVVDGIETTLPLFRSWCATQDIIDGNYHIHWLERFLAEGGMDRVKQRARPHSRLMRSGMTGEPAPSIPAQQRAPTAGCRSYGLATKIEPGTACQIVRACRPRPTHRPPAAPAASRAPAATAPRRPCRRGRLMSVNSTSQGRPRREVAQRVRRRWRPPCTSKPCSDSASAIISLIRNSSSTSRTDPRSS